MARDSSRSRKHDQSSKRQRSGVSKGVSKNDGLMGSKNSSHEYK